jgi:hypothetical protein
MAFNSITDKITLELTLDELKTLDKHIEYNEETKSVFDKIKYAYPQLKMTLENEGEYAVVSYNDTTYYRIMGETTYSWYIKKGVSATHPVRTFIMVTDGETERLLEGLYYNHIEVKKEKVNEWEPTPQTPEQVADGLKGAFREAVKQGVVSSSTKSPTLYDLIADWWDEIFMNNNEAAVTIESLVDDIEKWLPKPQSAAGSQNSYVECSVEGFNDCLTQIKGKLR